MQRRFPFTRTLATVCTLRLKSLTAACWLLLFATLQPVSAQSRPPIPLHTDPNLAASIVVRGQFQSLIVDEARPLTLRVWAADFSPNEQVDFDQLESRAFSVLELPQEAGWGLFAPMSNYLEIQVRVTDSQGRLGRVEFRRADTWQLVSSIWANVYRTEASGVFSIPSELREMVAEVWNDTGRVLARIAVDVGKFDRVAPVIKDGSFEPFRIDPVYCPHFGAQPGDTVGESGHPYTAPGSQCSLSLGWRSWTTIYTDFTNDVPTPNSMAPIELHDLVRKKMIANTVDLDRFKIGDPQGVTQLAQALQSASQEDLSIALPRVTVPPYSEGCVKWRVYHYGIAKAVLAIPFEKRRRGAGLGALWGAIQAGLGGKKDFLSILVASLANELLLDIRNQQQSGLEPGQVIAWGDVYSVVTNAETWVPRLLNLTQEWTVKINALYEDGSTQEIEGDFEANPTLALTNPAPPLPASIGKKAPASGTTVQLAKGWEWTLKPTAPGGQETKVRVPRDGIREVILYVHMRRAGGTPPAVP